MARRIKVRDPSSGATFDATVLDAALVFLVGDELLRFAPGAVLLLMPETGERWRTVASMAASTEQVIAVGEEIIAAPGDPGPLPKG